jgi:uncharacterized membrane protein
LHEARLHAGILELGKDFGADGVCADSGEAGGFEAESGKRDSGIRGAPTSREGEVVEGDFGPKCEACVEPVWGVCVFFEIKKMAAQEYVLRGSADGDDVKGHTSRDSVPRLPNTVWIQCGKMGSVWFFLSFGYDGDMRISLLAALVGWAGLMATPVMAAEQIRDFSVEATLSADRAFAVSETITYDFSVVPHHGIERVIPITYDRNGAKYRLHVDVGTPTLDKGPVPASVSHGGEVVRVRIGDPDTTIKGIHAYVIPYQTTRALNTFEDHHELYWNVTGNGWNVPIGAVTFVLHAPASADKVMCFTGRLGETASGCTVEQKGKDLVVKTKAPLKEQEGLTVVASFPLSAIASLTPVEKLRQFVQDNAWAVLPFVTLLGMYVVWRVRGREPKGRGTVVPQYETPSGLTPIEMASLREQSVPMKGVTATILDLARRGYLQVKYKDEKGWLGKVKHTFTLLSKKEPDEALAPFERTLLEGLFDGDADTEVNLKDLQGDFWESLEQARGEVFEALQKNGLFGRNPSVVRGGWIGLASLVFVVSFFFINPFGPAFLVAGWLSALIIVAFGWHMPRKTKLGAERMEEVEGFKWFLSVTEEARLAFTDAPAKTPAQFAAFLPAAVAFGVEKEWAKQFKGLEVKPAYLEGSSSSWDALTVSNLVDDFHAASASSMYQAPASTAGGGSSGFSGGGSGGGFGGGGGGSW